MEKVHEIYKLMEAIEVSKCQVRVREAPGNTDLALKLDAAETMLQDLKSNMAILGKEAAAATAAVEAQQQRLTLQRLISMVKWRQELKAKELAVAQVEEERRAKEAIEASNKRKHEASRLKIEIDFQRHKDDLQRLEQELSRLKASAQLTEPHNSSNTSPTGDEEGPQPQGETIATLLNELDKLEDSSEKEVNCDRECLICKKDEVSVVFLPCAHQVLCANCNDDYGKKGKATCPCCRAPIEQRIRVFGASS